MDKWRQGPSTRRNVPARGPALPWRTPDGGRNFRQTAALEAWLDSRLRQMYDSLVAEPLPEALLDSLSLTPNSRCIDKSGAD